MNIEKFKNSNSLVKNKFKSIDTTITIKTSHEIRNIWNSWCIKNDVNARKTLENFIIEITKDKK